MPSDPDQILARLAPAGIQLGLERPRRLLARLGNPQLTFPTVLVGGTNGKGSTAALLASMARAAGYRTGLYTSPPLQALEEMIQVDGQAIDRDRLGGLLEQVLTITPDREEPTAFEVLTAAAFLALAEEDLDLAMVEVGMGGARDVTNLTDPKVSLLTSVGLEHTRWLGDNLAEIAQEKAGVFRRGRPAYAATEEMEVREVLREVARKRGAKLTFLDEVASLQSRSRGSAGQTVDLRTAETSYTLDLALVGEHQARNLALAVLAAEALAAMGWSRLDDDAIRRGAAACRWPGHLEEIRGSGGRSVILDTAHNPQGVRALLEYLGREAESFDLLFGVLDDKDAEGMLPPLAEAARAVTLTTPRHPRGRDPRSLVDLVPDSAQLTVEEDLVRALRRGLAPPGTRLLVCGSTYLVGPVRQWLRKSRPTSASGVSGARSGPHPRR
jgi:dihydrofolate synthase/folylpolyglutamate synthase